MNADSDSRPGIDLRLSAKICGLKQLFSFPLRLALLQPRLDSLFGVFGLHQPFHVNFLRAGQTLIEMDGVPGVESFLGVAQSRGAELEKMVERVLDGGAEIRVSVR